MITIHLLIVLLALVCFLLATLGVGSRFNLVAAGLFLWLLSTVIAR